MSIYVVGHQNPDTDSICAAITLANLRKELGEDVEAIRCGKINAETEFVLDKFGVKAPKLVERVSEGEQVFLVDHNELSQAIPGIEEAEIVGVVDHHRIGGISTGNPIYFRNEPVGCTSTIVTKLYKENNVEISDSMAGLLLSAILSDTVIFKSPTCTKEDKVIVKQLAKQLGVDIEEYGKELFQAGSVVNMLSAKELVQNDYKEYEFAGDKIAVGQIEIMGLDEVDAAKKEEILAAIKELVEAEGYRALLLMITDIMAEGTLLTYNAEAKEIVAGAFDVDAGENEVYLAGVLSRKKQIIPVLSDYFA
ncbi:manganese-dependent inorganic pyrophosphatase [Orenia metallireducens]|jgi:manganese-dependent inorganic pyrophosphatase|uniref:inorganic diphosphatase n=1 Tax=Orenia metallireducens TaxID=1413210 RepID=A0A285GEM8_9FIRM|nr:manganese-dependent inorganic pyrophosphatase [Orenia metallireducens]PRX32533.1 manganese-dependent inorganic pyrophosphatase [Orenia metallireducens]SNY20946.1 manganese-dependent inorganic pyrophosphatase [Orenia metallireducens]